MPLAKGWDRHRRAQPEGNSKEAKARETGRGSREKRLGTQASSIYWQKKAVVKSTDLGAQKHPGWTPATVHSSCVT